MLPSVEAGQVLPTTLASPAPSPRRLGGWLLLALVTLFAWPLQFVSAAIPVWLSVRQHGLGPIWEQDPTWLLLAAWRVGSSGALGALSLWTLRPFLKKRRAARALMLAFFVATFVVGIANYVIGAAISPVGAPPPDMWRVVISTVVAGAWVKYFTSSVRVRETFVLP